jgi:glycosyltransferase involved in cell wall biosynthesis
VRTEPIVVAFPFIGDEVGGSHVSAINLVSRLDSSKVRPIIVLHRADGPLADYLARQGMSYILAPASPVLAPAYRAPSGNKFSIAMRYIAALPRLARFLAANGVEIVHTNDGRMHATWSLPTRLTGAKLLWHHRGDPEALGANVLAPLLANHIVTVSKFSCPSRPIVPIERKVTVLHSPFDHPASLPDRAACRLEIAQELGLGAEARFAGYFGVLVERKRPVLFVDVIAAYLKRHPEAPLHGLLFGRPEAGGPRLDEAVTERAAELGISDRIHLMGHRSPIAPYMCGVEALLVPAVSEPFGRTLIESMLLGTPVIATDHGGNPEAITNGRNGFLVKPETAEAFVEPLHRLLSDDAEWRRISVTARCEALDHYGVTAHIQGVTDIYDRMARHAAAR